MAHAAIDRRLKALNTDYIDVYLVHWPDRTTPFDETMEALEEIVQQGKGEICWSLQFYRRRNSDVHGNTTCRCYTVCL